MKAKQIIDKLLENWPVKIICFIVAIGLYIFNQATQIEKKSFVLPVQVIEEGEYMNISDKHTTVNVTIRAKPDDISTIHTNQITACVNLNGITESGVYDLPVIVKVNDELLAMDPLEIQVKPETIKLDVEHKELKYLAVKPSIVGEPAHGYKVTDIIVEPSYVQAVGPESVIESTAGLYTEKIDIANQSKDYTYLPYYVPVNKLISVENQGPYSVKVQIEAEEMEKEYAALEIKYNGLAENLIYIPSDDKITVKLSGTMLILEKYTPGTSCVSVDLSGITQAGEYELPVKYSFPSTLKLLEKSTETVKIEIQDKPVVETAGEVTAGQTVSQETL